MNKEIGEVDEKFRDKFIEQHKKLKSMTHLCQHRAYANEAFSLEEASTLSHNCYLPMLMVRKHAQSLLGTSKDSYKKCLLTTPQKEQVCLEKYKNELKSKAVGVQSMYAGHLQNFSTEGSLIKPVVDQEY